MVKQLYRGFSFNHAGRAACLLAEAEAEDAIWAMASRSGCGDGKVQSLLLLLLYFIYLVIANLGSRSVQVPAKHIILIGLCLWCNQVVRRKSVITESINFWE
jgi:hypothetical protein